MKSLYRSNMNPHILHKYRFLCMFSTDILLNRSYSINNSFFSIKGSCLGSNHTWGIVVRIEHIYWNQNNVILDTLGDIKINTKSIVMSIWCILRYFVRYIWCSFQCMVNMYCFPCFRNRIQGILLHNFSSTCLSKINFQNRIRNHFVQGLNK